MKDTGPSLEEIEETLRNAKKILSRYKSSSWQRKLKKLYRNRRAMKKQIRQHEERLASSLASFDVTQNPSQLNSEMEWFLTWRVKLMKYAESMWCDGAGVLELRVVNKCSYRIKAKACIGPESNVGELYECDVTGTITLSQNRQRLRSYQLEIRDGDETYFARKAS